MKKMNGDHPTDRVLEIMRGETPWKWVALYRFKDRWNRRPGIWWIVYPHQKTLILNAFGWCWELAIRWYPGRLTSYLNPRRDNERMGRMNRVKKDLH